MNIQIRFSLLLVLLGIFGLDSVQANAAKYSSLKKDGYKVSSLTRNKAGLRGWVVSKGGDRHFCRMRASQAILNESTVAIFTSNDRLIKGARTINGKKIDPYDSELPLWSDLKRGKVRVQDVGRCRKLR